MSETNENQADKPAEYVSPFIPDGYTLTATIPAVPGHWSAVKLVYRPICADEEKEIFAQSQLYPGRSSATFYAPIFAQKIIDWDLKFVDPADKATKKLPITADNIKRFKPAFYDQLRNVLDGTTPGVQEKN